MMYPVHQATDAEAFILSLKANKMQEHREQELKKNSLQHCETFEIFHNNMHTGWSQGNVFVEERQFPK